MEDYISMDSSHSQLERHAKYCMNTHDKQMQMFNQMRWYPLALIIGQGPGCIRRIIELTGNQPPFAMDVIHALFSGLFGIITAVIYGTKAWDIYRREFVKCCSSKE